MDQNSGTAWDTAYSSGRWNYLKRVSELAHYAVIVSYCQILGQRRRYSILDTCCGEGILREYFGKKFDARYVGIDFSSVAIQRARRRKYRNSRFIRADVANYVSAQKFDIIIFNECLYYFTEPLQVMERFEKALSRRGVFIVSMYVSAKSKNIWTKLQTRYSVIDEVIVENVSHARWIIKVLSVRKR
jgi:trans-aconitate methyltransferase